jgi:tRNA threonylcarbamoyladenosine biosynthesis protein TsaB
VRILAIETSEGPGSVAVADGPNLLAHSDLRGPQRTAQALVPEAKALLDRVGWRPDGLKLVAVGIGPGSFTGLRIGVTMARTLAYAAGAEILGIDTLETLAAGVPEELAEVAVAVDAQRGEAVACTFRRDEGGWMRPSELRHRLPMAEWLDGLPDAAALCSPVLRKIAPSVPPRLVVVDPTFWVPSAAVVARLAFRDYQAGRRDDLWTLAPVYSRRAAAEETKPLAPSPPKG